MLNHKIKIIFAITSLMYSNQDGATYSKKGMVVSTSYEASIIGKDILEQGGNAIDAAVAVGFALAVTSPSNGNIGGGGFMVCRLPSGKSFSIDYREKAPEASNEDMFLTSNKEVIPYMSLLSRAASGVPGTVDGLIRALNDYGSGKYSLSDLIKPAINLAKNGFPLSIEEAEKLNYYRSSFSNNKASSNIFIKKNKTPWGKGDLLIQEDLSKTLKTISKKGRDGFYKGHVAKKIIKEMKKGLGKISLKDLEKYESKYRDVVKGSFLEYEVLSMAPPSSGGLILIHMLNMLETYDLKELELNSAEYIHLITEIEKRAYADRAEHFGDPDFWDVPKSQLLSKEYAASRTKDISMLIAKPSNEVYAHDFNNNESDETCHYSIIDSDGFSVSVTTTLNSNYGSCHVVKGAGFLLNNQMDDFSIKPGVPNLWGLVGNKANSIAPYKRPLSSMTPTIVLKNDSPFLILGSPGGSKIITTVFQCLLNATIFNMDVQEAVASARFHHQWKPDNVIFIEPVGFSQETIKKLESMGHIIKLYNDGAYIGEANNIQVNDDGLIGSNDFRGETHSSGY